MLPLRSSPLHPAMALLLLTWSAAVMWSHELPPVARAALVVGYLLVAPGLAVVPFLGRAQLVLHALLVLSLSVAVAVGLSTAMSETGWWHVDTALGVTVGLVTWVVTWRVWRDRRAFAVRVGGAR